VKDEKDRIREEHADNELLNAKEKLAELKKQFEDASKSYSQMRGVVKKRLNKELLELTAASEKNDGGAALAKVKRQ
jgi:hypothetical protein